MPLTFGCPTCGKLMRVADALAGKPVRCPHCGGVAHAPEDVPVVPPVDAPPDWTPPRPEAEAFDWSGFAGGCRLVCVGVWFEAVAYLVPIGVVIYVSLKALFQNAGAPPGPGPLVGTGLLFGVLFFLPLLLGSVFLAFGRMLLAPLPRRCGAGGLVATAGVLSVLRPVLLLIAVGLFAYVEFGKGTNELARIGALFALGAVFLGWIAETALIPAMGIVGGVMPSAHLRRSVGRLCFAVLLATLAWTVLVVTLLVVKETDPFPAAKPDPGPAVVRRAPAVAAVDPTDYALLLGAACVGVVLLLGFTAMHHAMYATGRAAALTLAPPD